MASVVTVNHLTPLRMTRLPEQAGARLCAPTGFWGWVEDGDWWRMTRGGVGILKDQHAEKWSHSLSEMPPTCAANAASAMVPLLHTFRHTLDFATAGKTI